MHLATLLLVLPILFADVSTRKQENILVIGDSEAGSIQFALANAKKKGESSAEAAARLSGNAYEGESLAFEYKSGTSIEYWSRGGHGHEAIAKHPEAGTVFIFLGTNDYYKRDVPDVEPLLQEVRAAGLKCVWAGNTAVYDKKWPLNAKLRAAVEKDCTYVDSEGVELGDKVHPTFRGVVQWLKLVWNAK